ncbi:hypothetical protein EHO60_16695 [Leptospira fletcheri]|uniref:Glycosyltransferase RgtA/B/C/D-like domain-containing protein n=1 Tax=Leptospira fletcheri TaxID=2484981 RepID=A0A4R9G649_9LEPT|nr:hypothetical protein [Leptospira fletcheri]TGK06227.1 hypothetical protein EHO60_16695 [Leptospira fletcheri]
MESSFWNKISDRIFSQSRAKWLDSFSVILFGYVVLMNSWVGEDSYITFRTVENFLNGFGLRWNVYERVQAYTHPLWMFGIAFFGALKIPLFYASLLLSWICIFGSAFLLVRSRSEKQETFAWILLLLVSCRAFVDYSTSGLENPASFLLLILLFLKGEKLLSNPNGKDVFGFALILSFAYLNRQDTVLFGVPYLAWLFLISFKNGQTIRWMGWGSLGLLPAFAWIVFSLLYYGYPFPNTAYAKLNTGVPSGELWFSGFLYLRNSVLWDPVSALALAFSIVYLVTNRKKGFNPEFLFPLLGILFYLIYILKIGGDFMAGRFVSLPFVAAVFVLTKIRHRSVAVFGFLCFILFMVLNPRSYLYTTTTYSRARMDGKIADEKSMYFPNANFLRSFFVSEYPDHGWAEQGRKYRKDKSNSPSRFSVCATLNVGYFGYYSGPERKIVDVYALTDPLLSKLKSARPWRIGHFGRNLPEGYLESIDSGENRIADPNLKEYYEKLKLLTESPDLFSKNRLEEILRENLGGNKQLLSRYMDEREQQEIPSDATCGLGQGF